MCSVVLGKDFIPRLGIHTMETMKTELLQAIQTSEVPKVYISSVVYFILDQAAEMFVCVKISFMFNLIMIIGLMHLKFSKTT